MTLESLDNLKVEDLCKDLAISKVTFFNYFSSKAQIIQYYTYKITYNLQYMLQCNHLSGKEALYYIFDSQANHPAGKNIMTTIMKYYLSHQVDSTVAPTEYEYYLMNAQAFMSGLIPISFFELIHGIIIDMGLTEPTAKTTTLNLIAGFYGLAFIMYVDNPSQTQDQNQRLSEAYHQFINTILQGEHI